MHGAISKGKKTLGRNNCPWLLLVVVVVDGHKQMQVTLVIVKLPVSVVV